MVTISMVREDGSLRHLNGYVTEFRLVRADGGFAHYQMVLEPWLAFTKLEMNSISFHGQSVLEITQAIFARYSERDWKTSIYRADPKLTCANQHNETDYNHLHRRWEELGLMYWYEHRADGHTLWLGDVSTVAEPIDAMADARKPKEIPFQKAAGSLEDDGIHEWQTVHRMTPSRLTLASFDYKNPYSNRVSRLSMHRQDHISDREVYRNTGSYGFKDYFDGEALVLRQMETMDAQ